jgi:hypothetical protein
MKLVNFRRLKSAVGHEHVNEKKIEIFINYQPSIKDKLPLEIVKLAKTALPTGQGTARRSG